MDFNYTKIRLGNWLFQHAFPLYNFLYTKFKRGNDRDEIKLLEKIIRQGDHVLDIGANIGFYAKIISRLCGPSGVVYCFEPDSINFRYLQKNVSGLKNVRLFHQAVSSEEGIIRVYKSKLLNVDHRTYPVKNYASVEDVGSVTIDNLVAKGNIQKIDVIKIDIQGYEMAAFSGMRNTLEQNRNLRILAEYWPHGFKRAGTSAVAFFDFFDQLGYEFSIIEGKGLSPLTREYVTEQNDAPFEFSFNVLIVRKTGSQQFRSY